MIEVQVGDTIVEFPDGTAPEVMQKALRTQFPPVVAQSESRQAGSAVEEAVRPITSLPGHYSDIVRSGQETMSSGLEDLRKPTGGDLAESALSTIKGLGKLAGGGIEYATAPIFAPVRSLLSKPLEETTGLPKEYTEFAAGLAMPIPKSIPIPSLGRGAQRAVPTVDELKASYRAAKDAPEVDAVKIDPMATVRNAGITKAEAQYGVA